MVLIHFLCNGDETQKLWKPLLTQFSLQEAHRNGLHNGIGGLSFVKSTTQPLLKKQWTPFRENPLFLTYIKLLRLLLFRQEFYQYLPVLR